ncbi:MAG: hypothetical protein A4E58_00052 [Syntrophorhabdus sp. PtaB.Bin006]|nr:MAG: hypothetical protein A4E58_00052 [Syntrophorhabdus sp. PtaB.Bin006]
MGAQGDGGVVAFVVVRTIYEKRRQGTALNKQQITLKSKDMNPLKCSRMMPVPSGLESF